jgi:serine protease Do
MKTLLSKVAFAFIISFIVLFFSQARIEWPQKAYSQNKGGPAWTELPETEKKNYSKEAAALNDVFTGLAAKLSPAVVNIFTKSKVSVGQGAPGMAPEDLFGFFFGHPGMRPYFQMPQQREAQSLGSGFLINKDGMIVTNSHVVQINGKNADQVRVKFLKDPATADGVEATVVGVDPGTDVAVLKLKDTKKVSSYIPLGDSSKLKVGEWVMAIGNPFGHTHSVTQGIISALGRSSEGLNIRSDFIQTDASINPGNSGGPLMNLSGEVIGINTAIDARGPGIGFAIPINVAKRVIRQLIDKGEVTRGWIGVVISNLSPQIAKSLKLSEPLGALIQEVAEGGPAAKAGLKAYDVIVDVNGKPVQDSRDLTLHIGDLDPGAKIGVKFYRGGKLESKTIEIGKVPSNEKLAKSLRGSKAKDTESSTSKKTGLVLSDLNEENRRDYQIPRNLSGALVVDIVPNSLAAQAGLEPGLVITEVNQEAVKSAAQAEKLIARSKNGVLLRVQTANQSAILSLEF